MMRSRLVAPRIMVSVLWILKGLPWLMSWSSILIWARVEVGLREKRNRDKKMIDKVCFMELESGPTDLGGELTGGGTKTKERSNEVGNSKDGSKDGGANDGIEDALASLTDSISVTSGKPFVGADNEVNHHDERSQGKGGREETG